MSDEKITECFFEDTPCLWYRYTNNWKFLPNCKACARGRNHLYPRTTVLPGFVIGILVGILLGFAIYVVTLWLFFNILIYFFFIALWSAAIIFACLSLVHGWSFFSFLQPRMFGFLVFAVVCARFGMIGITVIKYIYFLCQYGIVKHCHVGSGMGWVQFPQYP